MLTINTIHEIDSFLQQEMADTQPTYLELRWSFCSDDGTSIHAKDSRRCRFPRYGDGRTGLNHSEGGTSAGQECDKKQWLQSDHDDKMVFV